METETVTHAPGTTVVFRGFQARDLPSLIRLSGWSKRSGTDDPHILEALTFVGDDGNYRHLSLEPTKERPAMYRFRLEELDPKKPNEALELVGYGAPGIANSMCDEWEPYGEGGAAYAGLIVQFHPTMVERRITRLPQGRLPDSIRLPDGGGSTKEIEFNSHYRGVLIAGGLIALT